MRCCAAATPNVRSTPSAKVLRMRPLLQHASRSFFANASVVGPRQSSRPFSNLLHAVSSAPSVCLQCQYRASIAFGPNGRPQRPSCISKIARRGLHRPPNDQKPKAEREALDGKAIELGSAETAPSPRDEVKQEQGRQQEGKKEEVQDDIAQVPADQLPSHREAQRWNLSKRFNQVMDDVLPKLAMVTQKVNTYTGTDYSGIAALKREIKEHEKLVKSRRAAIEEAKHALDAALSQQASSQKEVVALLERKHSWSATDLERYMSLIRSEHINDQAVKQAKENITLAENGLEDARSQLERRERAQYHEEQIWSDTIRRNSTWVTFGLMGLNIFLLLATMIVIEPWRRRRMVREIKAALEAQKATVDPAVAVQAMSATLAAVVPTVPDAPAVESETEKATEAIETNPSSPVVEDLTDSASPIEQGAEEPAVEAVAEETTKVPIAVPDDVDESASPATAPDAEVEVVPLESVDIEDEVRNSTTFENWQEKVTYVAKDIISERPISMRRVDFTAAILQGAAAGAVITAAIVAMVLQR